MARPMRVSAAGTARAAALAAWGRPPPRARESSPTAGAAACAASRAVDRFSAKRARKKRAKNSGPKAAASPMPMVPSTASKAPAATTVCKIPLTRAGLACIHCVKRSINGLMALSNCKMGCLSASPAMAMALNMRFFCICSCALSAELRAAASRAMLPCASALLASSIWRRSSSVLVTSLAILPTCSLPTSSAMMPRRSFSGMDLIAWATCSKVPTASLAMPPCTCVAVRPISPSAF